MKSIRAMLGIGMLALSLCPCLSAAEATAAGGGEEPEGVTDLRIARAVDSELLSQGLTIAHHVDVESADGIVTLRGSVDSLLDVDRALEVTRATRGVRSVVNRLVVEPFERSDARLETAVREALARDPATDAASPAVAIEVDDGIVRLTGEVASWQQLRLVERITRGVSGARGVENELEVDYGDPRPDAEIADEVRRRLAADVGVDAQLVDVEVSRGQVTLSGFVGSASERERAESDAWVRGVRSVDTHGLEVRWWARDEMRRRSPVRPAPEEIERAVRDALVYDARVPATDVRVLVDDGVVILRGTVPTALAKRAAEDDARNTLGVGRVRNLLKVRAAEQIGDEVLEERIRQVLADDPWVGGGTVTVNVARGRAYLDGWADSRPEAERAEWLAMRVPGVLEVRSRLDLPEAPVERSDPELRAEIEEQLYWDSLVDERAVDVSVEDGIATLQGWVDDWDERRRAAENAREAGARDVRNLLGVRIGPHDQRA